MNDEAARFDLNAFVRDLRSRVPVDAAELLAKESPEHIEQVLAALPPDFAARVVAQLPGAMQAENLEIEVPISISEITEPVRGALPAASTVAEAQAWLRRAESPAEITYLYVTDEQQKLLGLVVMRDLILAEPQQTLAQVMIKNPFRLAPDTAVSEAVKLAIKRHYPVYPVCDADERLIGIVRGWKLFERQAIEIAAQSGRMVGVGKEERVQTGIWESLKNRHPWLQVNLLTAFLAAFVVGHFEDTITQIVALAAFLPVLAGQSGNNGCQALAITLRGYTLGDLDTFPLRKHLYKELVLGAVNGFLTGIIAGIAMWLTANGDGADQALLLAVVICAAMTGACMISGMLGVLVPLALKKFGADPATASSIFLTTGTDIAGMGLMLALATAFVL